MSAKDCGVCAIRVGLLLPGRERVSSDLTGRSPPLRRSREPSPPFRLVSGLGLCFWPQYMAGRSALDQCPPAETGQPRISVCCQRLRGTGCLSPQAACTGFGLASAGRYGKPGSEQTECGHERFWASHRLIGASSCVCSGGCFLVFHRSLAWNLPSDISR